MSTLPLLMGIDVAADFIGNFLAILLESSQGTTVDWRHTETSAESLILYFFGGLVALFILMQIGRASPVAAITFLLIFIATVILYSSGLDTAFGGRNTLEYYWR